MKTAKFLIVVIAFALIGLSGKGQVIFQKAYGGAGSDEGFSVQQTKDSGYIVAGGLYIPMVAGYMYLIKTNLYGDTLWTKTYSIINGDGGAQCVQQTTDGGYILAGGVYVATNGGTDIYLIKTDSIGDTLWTKIYTGNFNQTAYFIQQTFDGGYIITGQTSSFGAGGYDIYLIKTNSLGDTLWTRTFGGTGKDVGMAVQQTLDSGYIVTGYINGDTPSEDLCLIKTNSNGDTLWTKTYGGIHEDRGNSVRQTTDGGFIIAGRTCSFGVGVCDVYLLKTDSIGNILWSKTYGGGFEDGGYSVDLTNDGGYIVTGYFSTSTLFVLRAYLIKTNSTGDTLWTRSYGGSGNERGYSIHQTFDGGYIMLGYTASFGSGSSDFYLIKTDSTGNGGCNFQNDTTQVNSQITPFTNQPLQISSGSIVLNYPSIISSGGIVTNLCSTEGIAELYFPPSLLLSPNPFTLQTTLTLQGTYHNPTLFIYNLLGQEVRSIAVGTNKQVTIPRSNLPAGMYFYKLIEENKEVIGIGKMMVE